MGIGRKRHWPRLACAAIILPLWLSGCQTAAVALAVIAAVQQETESLCRFVPNVETILKILEVKNASIDDAVAIAKSICAVVAPSPSFRTEASPPYDLHGMKIEGYFVRSTLR